MVMTGSLAGQATKEWWSVAYAASNPGGTADCQANDCDIGGDLGCNISFSVDVAPAV